MIAISSAINATVSAATTNNETAPSLVLFNDGFFCIGSACQRYGQKLTTATPQGSAAQSPQPAARSSPSWQRRHKDHERHADCKEDEHRPRKTIVDHRRLPRIR